MRYSVAYYFVEVLGSPAIQYWDGKTGVISHIMEVFDINKKERRNIKRILSLTEYFRINKKKFDGKSNKRRYPPLPILFKTFSDNILRTKKQQSVLSYNQELLLFTSM